MQPIAFLPVSGPQAGRLAAAEKENACGSGVDYIHQNPVVAGLVYRAEDYIYSSASNYAGLDQIIDVDCLFDFL